MLFIVFFYLVFIINFNVSYFYVTKCVLGIVFIDGKFVFTAYRLMGSSFESSFEISVLQSGTILHASYVVFFKLQETA
jgi:hypothetical protein